MSRLPVPSDSPEFTEDTRAAIRHLHATRGNRVPAPSGFMSYAGKAGAETGEVAWDFIRSVWSSRSGLAIAPLQDLLNLGVEGRMNVPGVANGNWRWRCTEEMLKPSIFDRLRELTFSSGRITESNAKKRILESAL